MNAHRTLLPTLLCLSSVTFAQTADQLTAHAGTDFAGAAPERYVLELASGTLRKVTAADDQGNGVQQASVATYLNDCDSGFFIVPFTDQEFVDWGVKSGGLTGFVEQFDMSFGTRVLDQSVGGPGTSLDLAFYSGTTGLGTLGTEVARFQFTGLPGVQFSGTTRTFVVQVDLSGGLELCLPDGPIGIGFCNTSAGIAGPTLTDINSCDLGQDDLIDSYTCPAKASDYITSFNFGSNPTASFYMVLYENDGSELASTAINNGAGSNPLIVSDGGTPPIMGQTWPLSVDTAVGGHALSTAVWYQSALPPGTLILGFGEVIVDPTTPQAFFNIVAGTGLNDHSVLVPKDGSLIGADFTVQAIASGGAPLQLGNGLDISVGF